MSISYANLLLVDNDPERSHTIATPLQHSGWYAITFASSPDDMWQQLRQSPSFDLLLIDINLLAADNFALTHQLRDTSPWRELPIIALATPETVTAVSHVVQLGIQDYLLYPELTPLVRTRINAILQTKLLQEQYITSLQAFNEMKKLADDLREVILPLGMALSTEQDYEQLLEKIVIEAKSLCNADAATLYLRDDQGLLHFSISITSSLGIAYGGSTGRPAPYAPLPLYDASGAPNHRNIATHVVHEGHSVSIPDIYAEKTFDFSGTRTFDDGINYHAVSCLTVPLQNDEIIGVLQLLNAEHPEETGRVIPFSIYHQLVAESLASQAALVLHNQRLQLRQQALQRYERELRIGRQIQQSFFPARLPQPHGWDLAVYFRSAREVAGDFYDVVPLPNGRLALIIADVCNKGVEAALFMALIRSLLRAFLQQYSYLQRERPFTPPNHQILLLDAVRLTNRYILDNHRQAHMFATLFISILDPTSGELCYINCGHNPPLWLNNGRTTPLTRTGLAIGLQPRARFYTDTIYLQPGDLLLAYTDGIIEAQNEAKQMFTLAQLQATMLAEAPTAAALLDQIETAVSTHLAGKDANDDLTMLALRRLATRD